MRNPPQLVTRGSRVRMNFRTHPGRLFPTVTSMPKVPRDYQLRRNNRRNYPGGSWVCVCFFFRSVENRMGAGKRESGKNWSDRFSYINSVKWLNFLNCKIIIHFHARLKFVFLAGEEKWIDTNSSCPFVSMLRNENTIWTELILGYLSIVVRETSTSGITAYQSGQSPLVDSLSTVYCTPCFSPPPVHSCSGIFIIAARSSRRSIHSLAPSVASVYGCNGYFERFI